MSTIWMILKSYGLKILLWVGGAMFKKIENWLYSESQVSDDIIISKGNLQYCNIDGISIIKIYLDVQNKTFYSSIDILPSTINVNEIIDCKSDYTIIKREKIGIEFKSILNKAQENKLLALRRQQDESRGRGVLKIMGYMIFYCNNRRIKKPILFRDVNLEGV